MMKRKWFDELSWQCVLRNGIVLTQYKDYKDINKLQKFDVAVFRLRYFDRIIKAVKREKLDKMIYFHRVFGSLFPFREERRIIYFGTETNLYEIEPVSGMEENTGCDLAFHITLVK